MGYATGKFRLPCLIRFYHGWYDARLSPTAELQSFNKVRNDPKLTAIIHDASRAAGVPGVVNIQAAFGPWNDQIQLPTSRKHTRNDCELNDCPRHSNPLQKIVDTLLTLDVAQLSAAGVAVNVITSDDDLTAAFRLAERYIFPPGIDLPPGLALVNSRRNGLVEFHSFPYSARAWTKPLGMR
ncbi:hypothetical protein [Cystobacter fuscus]|uniref:hypothetical protein n=1 Tax=Cystobacter fuscus TaxID=43 RepID=UPI002B2E3313|nr:hypothetical protein F0U63_29045 [Cystobacter fuscus]